MLFVLLFITSIMLTVNNNRFQRSKFLAATQEVIGSFYAVTAVIYAYIELRTINEDMTQRIVDLENQIAAYQNALKLTNDTLHSGKLDIDQSGKTYQWVSAKIVNNNISKIDNYLTLDKGELDGIEVDMGVVSPRGIVGVVKQVSAHFSQVIPVLNDKFHPSCMVKNNKSFGPLVWNGGNPLYSYLTELPRHVTFEVGDTILTSGYSTIFPAGLLVGTIAGFEREKDDNYNTLKVKLFTDFSTLSNVMVVQNKYQHEQKSLESRAGQY